MNKKRSNRKNSDIMRPATKILIFLLIFMIISSMVLIVVIKYNDIQEKNSLPDISPVDFSPIIKELDDPPIIPTPEPLPKEEEIVAQLSLEIEEMKTNGKPKIAFTFDDGPMEHTQRLLDCLEKYNVGATFFILGVNAVPYPDTIKRMGELGLEVQNHSYKHTKLKKENLGEFLDEIKRTSDFVKDQTGKPTNLVRLPGGAFGYDEDFLKSLPFPIINWTIDTKDWKHKDINLTVESIMSEAKDGSVVLIHDPYLPTIEAIEQVIPRLLEQGYDIVSLSDLAAIKEVELENGKVYTGFYNK